VLNRRGIESATFELAKVDVKASGPWRTLEIIGGAIVIVLALIALADISFTVQTFVVVVAAGLVIGGLFRIGVGVFAIVLPSPLRTLNTAGGIVAVVLGIAALLDLQGAQTVLLNILALALLLVGAFEIGNGVVRHPHARLRASIVTLGILTIVLASVVVIDPSVGQTLIAAALSLALLLVGVRNIIHGITGHHRTAAPIDSAVTAA
jgi:uncharacterized membrane protein HdeD (DUF308 family)